MSSIQHKLDRVRRPRVHITYDVETNGAMQKLELPFVVGVLADLSGHPTRPLPPMKERKVVQIDRDNFNDVLSRQAPRLALKVENLISGDDSKLAMELNFKHIDDFEPGQVARQIAPLRELLEMRDRLTQLLSKMEGNDKLEQLLADIIANTDKARRMAAEMGLEVEAPEAQAEEQAGNGFGDGESPSGDDESATTDEESPEVSE
jgi:type VI secretion system protein ImpB